ncbi:hypothetical protein [Nitrosomonas sp.]|uniref:hypothetical protein n=1 Tax=Nitrosomonas sp. TaxID=42353 RepID=UPI001DA3DB07|nr:hypothetical protein [Nitrosomonas sp.]MBX3615968.1 hypothetical protein [Nitrosomonas sp.]
MGEDYYFNLSTAGFDTLRRQTDDNVAAQERLTRTNALRAMLLQVLAIGLLPSDQ